MSSKCILLLERALAAAALVVISPILLAIALSVVAETGFPVFFRQRRAGRSGQPFDILKFRSMRIGPAGIQLTASGDNRVTRVGRIIRRYKLDELPQLWNVVNGTMRLVGPRPEVPRYVDVQDPLWREVLSVPPGITDIATLLYRNEEAILASASDVDAFYRNQVLPAKLRLNVEYLRRRTPASDLRVLWATALSSLFPEALSEQRIRSYFEIAK
jgi:lipopolysaccharide/colanic/teichoic acid biosynthesis glycosyltransferase